MAIWVILIINCVITIFNTAFLIAIASLLMKLINYRRVKKVSRQQSSELVDLPIRPTYADLVVTQGEVPDDLTIINHDGVSPRQPNSDGVGGIFN